MSAEIWQFKQHIWTLFQQDFRSVYHAASLGALWNVILPLTPLSVYLFLSWINVFPRFDGVSSAAFLTFGVTIWFLLVACITVPMNGIQAKGAESMRTSLPLSAAIVATFATTIFEFLVRVLFVLGVILYTAGWPKIEATLLPFVLMPGLLLCIGIGLVLGVLNVIARDVSRVVAILLQYGIFMSGVIFPLPQIAIIQAINSINPFALYINISRDLVFKGEIQDPIGYAILCAVSLLVFLIGTRTFYIMEVRLRGVV